MTYTPTDQTPADRPPAGWLPSEPPPPPVPAPPTAQRPRRRALWLIVAGLSALATIATVGVQVVAWAAQRTATSTWSQTHPISALQINVDSADVTVSPGHAGMASLRSTLTWDTAEPTVTETWEGDVLVIAEHCSSRSLIPVDDCGAALELKVPAAVPVQATVSSGSVEVDRMTGDVRAHADSGDLDFTGDSGFVWARVESGSITADGLVSQHVDLGASSGDVAAAFAAAPASVVASVSSGSVTLTVPKGTTYRVTGQSQSGERSIADGLAQESATRTIQVDAASGDVYVGYPDGS